MFKSLLILLYDFFLAKTIKTDSPKTHTKGSLSPNKNKEKKSKYNELEFILLQFLKIFGERLLEFLFF